MRLKKFLTKKNKSGLKMLTTKIARVAVVALLRSHPPLVPPAAAAAIEHATKTLDKMTLAIGIARRSSYILVGPCRPGPGPGCSFPFPFPFPCLHTQIRSKRHRRMWLRPWLRLYVETIRWLELRLRNRHD